MVIEIILAALALTAAGSAVVAYRRKKRSVEEAAPALAAHRSLSKGELLPDDVVTHLGTDYLIEGVSTLQEGGRTVVTIATMTADRGRKFLVIDHVEAPRCLLGDQRDDATIGGAVPSWVADGSLELRLSRRASVRLESEGETDLPRESACDYGIFLGPGERKALLAISTECSLLIIGRGVTEAGLTLLPGGG